MSVTQAEWDAWEAERNAANRATGKAHHDANVRRYPQLIDELRDRVQTLELQAFLLRELIASYELLLREAREQHAFAEDLLEAVLAEHRPVRRLEAA